MLTKLTRQREGGVGQMQTQLTKGEVGLERHAKIGWQTGGGWGVRISPFLADIISKQPL